MNRREAMAREACRLLREYFIDLIAGTWGLKLFETSRLYAKATPAVRTANRRMCLSHLIVTLAKWEEFYRHYKSILPSDVRDDCLKLRQELERRGVRNFRNTVVGHNRDNKLGRVLTADEIENRLESVTGGDLDAFRLWINDPTPSEFPKTVVALCERVRNRIAEENGLDLKNLE